MTKPIRVVQWGHGAMGRGIAKLILQKEGMKIAGAICTCNQPGLVGSDFGDVLGLGKKLDIIVTDDPSSVLDKEKVDIVVLATNSWVKTLMPSLRQIISAGINVITISEEMSDPAAQNPELAKEIDELAKEHSVTVLGSGVNPGFVLDLLVITLTGVCHSVERIEARRVNDLSPYGLSVMKGQGVGTSSKAFHEGISDGSIVGHVGFPESIHMISDALGLGVDRVEQTREPIFSKVYRETPNIKVEPGMVAGCSHTGVGYAGNKEVIRLIHPQQIHPHLEGQDTGDYIDIYGIPEIHLAIKPEIAGGVATIGITVNMIPHVVAATPGMKRMIDLPVPAALMALSAYERQI